MKKNISKKKNNDFTKLYAIFLTLISLIIFIINCYKKFNKLVSFKLFFVDLIEYFTSQSNILILIVMFLFFTSLRFKKIFSVLMFIAAIDILLTFTLVHSFIYPNEKFYFFEQIKEKIIFLDIKHYHHTIIPILYLIFYFFKTNRGLNIKKAYLGVIHPLCYFFFFLFANYFDLFQPSYYPYDIIDPKQKGIFNITWRDGGQGYGYLTITIIILTIIYYWLSYSVLFLKNKINLSKKS
ncbi:MAG: hypothetical protein Q2306_01715 [Phytoplasma sp.]|uniref:hypothetical protein n=1 Tax=Phytoplasma sp. TaxID=2155 RepID=UPI002B4038EB|nr:hypothetical protein [Phytoplasma sp.]WRH06605.1 MAG: hypothetical protein Q2306_01715 [Phytoplasma sp.]